MDAVGEKTDGLGANGDGSLFCQSSADALCECVRDGRDCSCRRLHLGWIDSAQGGFKAFRVVRNVVGVAGVVIGAFLLGSWLMVGPGVSWRPYSDDVMEQARTSNKPVIVDFSATWCTPCRELEDITFRDPAVVKQAEDNFVMVKVDLTKKGNPLHEKLVTQYSVKGVPTVVFFDSQGRERKDLRLVDFIPADQFVSRMTQAMQASTSGS